MSRTHVKFETKSIYKQSWKALYLTSLAFATKDPSGRIVEISILSTSALMLLFTQAPISINYSLHFQR